MYEELVTALRKRAVELPEKFSKNAENIDLFLKAVDAIKELRERVAASEVTIKRQSDIIQAKDRDLQRAIDAKPQWIPVTERLPDMHVEVLVCTEDYGKTELGFATVAVFDGTAWLEAWERKTYLTAVTHWMPLPEPPKEE